MKPPVTKLVLFSLLLLIVITSSAQVAAVTFTVRIPAIDKDEKVFIAGSFNYWHEKDSLYRLRQTGNQLYSITIPVFDARRYEYKYTLGSWDKVEVAANDSNIVNRSFVAADKKQVIDSVVKWRQPSLQPKDSSEQLKRLTTMKDSLMLKLKPELAGMQGLFKEYIQNMLQQNPDKNKHAALDQQSLQKLSNVYRQITQLVWDVCNMLSAAQKEQVLKAVNNSGEQDAIRAFGNALNDAMK